MAQRWDIKRMAEAILDIKQAAVEPPRMSGGIQAVDRNVDRILATVKMLEINVNDVASIEE